MKRELPSLQINWSQVITSLLIGAVFGAIAIVRLSDTQTITISGHTKAIEKLEVGTVSTDAFAQHAETNRREFDAITKSLDALNNKVDRLLLR